MVHLVKFVIIFGLVISSCHPGHIEKADSIEPEVNSEDVSAFMTIRHNIFSAFRDWQKLEKGYSGTLLYYYQTEGPLTAEFYKMYEGRIPLRVPQRWALECLECESKATCTAIMTVKFNTEKEDKLMEYEFVNTGFFSPYSEKQLTLANIKSSEIAECKAKTSKIFEGIE